jgi:hypothetical protein
MSSKESAGHVSHSNASFKHNSAVIVVSYVSSYLKEGKSIYDIYNPSSSVAQHFFSLLQSYKVIQYIIYTSRVT